MAKVICVLYDNPVDGYPYSYPRDEIPRLARYPNGRTSPSPREIDYKPGALLGSCPGELGLRTFLETAGHELRQQSGDRDHFATFSSANRSSVGRIVLRPAPLGVGR